MRTGRSRPILHLILLLAMLGGRGVVLADALRFHSTTATVPAARLVDARDVGVTTESHECVVGSAIFNPAFVRDVPGAEPVGAAQLTRLLAVPITAPTRTATRSTCQSRAPPLV